MQDAINQKISSLPFATTIIVGGDVNTYYPVPVLFSPEHKLTRLIVYRYYNSAHPASLGADHVAGLLLELWVRGVAWSDFTLTRLMYYGFAYHQSVAAIESSLIGRIIYLRGGGMEYTISSDSDMGVGSILFGTELLKPIIAANTSICPLHPASPYAGGGVKVSPRTTTDPMWSAAITNPVNF